MLIATPKLLKQRARAATGNLLSRRSARLKLGVHTRRHDWVVGRAHISNLGARSM